MFPKIMCLYKFGFTHTLQPEFCLCFNDFSLCILIQASEVSIQVLFMHATFSISVSSECEECLLYSEILPSASLIFCLHEKCTVTSMRITDESG